MKQLFTCIILLLCLKSIGQEVTVVKDTTADKKSGIVLSNGKVIWEGDQIKCGRGSLPNGDFKYIHTSSASWVAVMSGPSAVTPISRQYNGLNLDVKKVDKMGNKKRGFKYILKVGGGNIVNYMCEIEDAINTGEVKI